MPKQSAPTIKTPQAETAQANNLYWLQDNVQKPIIDAALPNALPNLSQAFDTKLAAPDRQNIEDQYAQSKQDILNNAGARGGMLQQSLKDNMLGRASDIASAQNQARQTGINRALGLLPAGFPGADSTLAASGQLANLGGQRNAAQANLNYQQNQANAQQSQQLFGGLGSLFSLFG
jgi:hypothetical protein